MLRGVPLSLCVWETSKSWDSGSNVRPSACNVLRELWSCEPLPVKQLHDPLVVFQMLFPLPRVIRMGHSPYKSVRSLVLASDGLWDVISTQEAAACSE